MLVAPLNWGLGHATRCIPIINALIKANYTPILASDGEALLLLQKEFPLLKSYTLPSYHIKYSKKASYLKLKLFMSILPIILAVKKEKKLVAKIVEKEGIVGIISDNRFGVLKKRVPSVYITHQLNVLSGKTTFITSKIHQKIIRQFNECWVPDFEGTSNFSSKLGHLKQQRFRVKYLGILSRLRPMKLKNKYDLLVLLSGPEPQRTLLENKLLKELKTYNGYVLFVRGLIDCKTKIKASANFRIVDYLLSSELEKALNQSRLIIARSGYSTIMDLATLGNKAFFIPTPGQFEQEYLAKILKEKLIASFSTQENFTIKSLKGIEKYSGFKVCTSEVDLDFFKIFESE